MTFLSVPKYERPDIYLAKPLNIVPGLCFAKTKINKKHTLAYRASQDSPFRILRQEHQKRNGYFVGAIDAKSHIYVMFVRIRLDSLCM